MLHRTWNRLLENLHSVCISDPRPFSRKSDNNRGAMSCFMFQSTVKPSEYGDLGEGGIVSVCINGVSVLSGLNLEKM